MAMQEPKIIVKGLKHPKSMDYAELKREGVQEVQRLSGRIWTDYNEHDPGVTILENLCYALTELGYKTNFDVKDLFFKKTEEKDRPFLKTFYAPEDILPPAPATEIDFRKLVIDHVKGVKNIWINPKKQSQVGTRINGLYEVLILVDETIKNSNTILKEVQDLLNSYRNLGEDFDVYRLLEFENIHFEANISISTNAIGESVYANVLSTVQALFSPTIPFYSEEEILLRPDGKEIIHNHPPVKNGYVLDEDLEQSSLNNISKLFTSRVIKAITEIEGVEEVFDFVFYVNGERNPSEIIQLEDYKVPSLSVNEILDSSLVNLYAGDIEYSPDVNVVKYTYEIEKNRKALKHKRYNEKPVEVIKSNTNEKPTSEIKSNTHKNAISEYFSIQNSFPKSYGITEYGLEGKISNTRLAQVSQLRAYLYFFEQLMANYLNQLANVDKLFSTDAEMQNTYFYQHIHHLNGYKSIFNTNGSAELPLEEINNKFDNAQERRNRILDHMLARFGEEFLVEAYNAIHRESSSLAKGQFIDENIKAKIKYLNNYIDISRNKAKGYNYKESYKNEENVSGLKKKIALLFNFKTYGFTRLDQVISGNLKINDKKTNPSKSSFSFNSDEPNFLADVLAYGVDRNNYTIENEKGHIIYFNNPASRKQFPIYKTAKLIDAEDALTKLMERLNDLNSLSEGFHMVEHILLRDVNAAFRFIYISEDNIELTSEFDYNDSSYSRTEFTSNLLSTGKTKTNYTIKKSGDLYHFILTKKSSKFRVTSENFSSKKETEGAIAELIHEFENTKIIDSDLDLRIHLDQDMSNISIYDEDPYSLQVTCVCPRWSGRFRSQKMKFLFENVVKLNAPAHLKFNFCWLSIPEMQLFEEAYEKWLDLKTEEKNRKTIDKLSAYLLLLFKKFKSGELEKESEKTLKKMKADLKV